MKHLLKPNLKREIDAKFRIFRDRRIYIHDRIYDDRPMFDPSYEQENNKTNHNSYFVYDQPSQM